MHQILWLLYIAIIWYKKSTSLPKLYFQKKSKFSTNMLGNRESLSNFSKGAVP